MQKFTNKLTIASTLLVLTATFTSQASAIETSGIGALPAHPRSENPRTKSIFVYDVTGNDVVSDAIKVINNTDTTKTLAVYPVDSQKSSDGAFACAQMADPKKAVGSWIKLAKSQVTLEANTNEVVPFTLTVPANVSAGEHDGCIVVQDAAPATQKSGNGIVLSFRSALRVAITTPGDLKANLSFTGVKIRDISSAVLGISPVIKNDGNVSADPSISVKLNGVGPLHYTFTTVGGQFPALPNQETRFNFEMPKPYWGGWYNIAVQATYKKPLSSGELSDTVTAANAAEATIFVMPQQQALIIEGGVGAVILILLILLIIKLIHRSKSSPPEEPELIDYLVKEGDTIESVAYHHHTTWKHLADINKLQSPYIMDVGQIIKVPAVRRKSHKASEASNDLFAKKNSETE